MTAGPSHEGKGAVFERLAKAFRQFTQAELAAWPFVEETIFWGYLAIDNFMSAALMAMREIPGRNHPRKIERFLATFPSAPETIIDAEQLPKYCRQWNDVRYERASVDQNDAHRLLNTLRAMERFCMDRVAEALAMKFDEVLREIERLNSEARTLEPVFPEDVYRYYDVMQQELEAAAEAAGHSRLPSKFGTVWNEITIRFFCDREWARSLMETDGEIGSELISIYRSFAHVADLIVGKRITELTEAGVAENDIEPAAWDFSLISLQRYKYRDAMEKLQEMAQNMKAWEHGQTMRGQLDERSEDSD